MPVQSTLLKSDLVFRVITGQDEYGEDVLRTKSFSKVKTNAPDQDVFDVAKAIEEVLLHPVFEIRRVDAELLEEGIYVIGFFFPVVPRNEARIRVQVSAAHTKDHLDRAIEAFTKVGKELGVIT